MNTQIDNDEIVQSTLEDYLEKVDLSYAQVLVVVDERYQFPYRPGKAYWIGRADTVDGMRYCLTLDKQRAHSFSSRKKAERVMVEIKHDIELEDTDKFLGYHIFTFGPLEE